MNNLNLKPVLTEKSLSDAKRGFYTFLVVCGLDKKAIKELVEKSFDVHVRSVRTMNYKKEVKKNYKGVKQSKKAFKKAIVSLGEKEKIAIFEEKGK